MPFEPISFVAGYAAGKGLDAAGRAVTPVTKRLFEEIILPWGKRKGSAPQLSLTSEQLLEFYKNETFIEIFLGDQGFVLPASMAVEPIQGGKLSKQKISFNISDDPFVPPHRLAAYTDPIYESITQSNKPFEFDGRVVRLANIKKDGEATHITLNLASYFDALCTNFAMDHRPIKSRKTLREAVHGESSCLDDFNDSPCVNHIGVVCMIESTDGMLILQNRSNKVSLRLGTVSASSSGTVSMTDVMKTARTKKFSLSEFANAAFRETLGEIGVEIENIQFLGIVREFLRGGKPEIYFYAKSDATLYQIISLHKHAEEREESRSIDGVEFLNEQNLQNEDLLNKFQKNIIDLLEKYESSANLTFVMGTLLTASHLLQKAKQQTPLFPTTPIQ